MADRQFCAEYAHCLNKSVFVARRLYDKIWRHFYSAMIVLVGSAFAIYSLHTKQL